MLLNKSSIYYCIFNRDSIQIKSNFSIFSVYCLFRYPGIKIMRILHKCEVLIEKSVPRVTIWHHVTQVPLSDAKL